MAVTAVVTRNHHTLDATTFIEFCTAALTGTYVTGGFTFNPFLIYAGKGSSPIASTTFVAADWYSPLGYTYRTTVSGSVATTKIFTTANTEFTNGSAVPDASVTLTIVKRKI
jgi:hypothetical protein